ncbi:GreA/GreB family elongation factor [Gordonia sp. CPCC 205515]|uniref:GreA/GreB family elongation factor n=1 Tax=Gordonia sp. CPCC 205515 TaxID=3140791 RepID=UPI003AF3DC7A
MVARIGKEELVAGYGRAIRRDTGSIRLAELEGELAALLLGRNEIDAEISREGCGSNPNNSDGLHRALLRRAENQERIARVAEAIAGHMAQRPESLLRRDLRRYIVVPGSVVDVYFGADRADKERLVIGPSRPTDTDRCSPESPLGRALLGKRAGQTVRYRCADGHLQTVTIVRVE